MDSDVEVALAARMLECVSRLQSQAVLDYAAKTLASPTVRQDLQVYLDAHLLTVARIEALPEDERQALTLADLIARKWVPDHYTYGDLPPRQETLPTMVDQIIAMWRGIPRTKLPTPAIDTLLRYLVDTTPGQKGERMAKRRTRLRDRLQMGDYRWREEPPPELCQLSQQLVSYHLGRMLPHFASSRSPGLDPLFYAALDRKHFGRLVLMIVQAHLLGNAVMPPGVHQCLETNVRRRMDIAAMTVEDAVHYLAKDHVRAQIVFAWYLAIQHENIPSIHLPPMYDVAGFVRNALVARADVFVCRPTAPSYPPYKPMCRNVWAVVSRMSIAPRGGKAKGAAAQVPPVDKAKNRRGSRGAACVIRIPHHLRGLRPTSSVKDLMKAGLSKRQAKAVRVLEASVTEVTPEASVERFVKTHFQQQDMAKLVTLARAFVNADVREEALPPGATAAQAKSMVSLCRKCGISASWPVGYTRKNVGGFTTSSTHARAITRYDQEYTQIPFAWQDQSSARIPGAACLLCRGEDAEWIDLKGKVLTCGVVSTSSQRYPLYSCVQCGNTFAFHPSTWMGSDPRCYICVQATRQAIATSRQCFAGHTAEGDARMHLFQAMQDGRVCTFSACKSHKLTEMDVYVGADALTIEQYNALVVRAMSLEEIARFYGVKK